MSGGGGGGRPDPGQAYVLWLDSLSRVGWAAKPVSEQVPVADALGRVSAAPVLARWPSPRSDCSAMDGIAVSATVVATCVKTFVDNAGNGDTSAGTIEKASEDGARLPAGAFAWIDTGDPMPDGADTVVMREWLLPQADGSVVIIGSVVITGTVLARGKHVRRAGEDFAAGEVLVPAGRRLRPGDLAAAAAGGHGSVRVARQPVVAIIPTGDEIRPAGSVPRRGDIIDTNSLMLAGRCRELGAVPVLSDVQPDDPDVLAAEIRRAALGADLVLVIAGSSRGRDDHTGAVLAQVGGVAVTGVAVRPGHPALLGHAKHRGGVAPVIGLPGYPLATAVIFELFAVPLLAAAGGVAESVRPGLLATLDRDWSSPPGVEDWVLVTLTSPPSRPSPPSPSSPDSLPSLPSLPSATPAKRGAGSISQLARADAWWRVSAGQAEFAAGTTIEVIALSPR
jgi:putative molybdopterin biosynthesis protein